MQLLRYFTHDTTLEALLAGARSREFVVRMVNIPGVVRDVAWHVSGPRQPGEALEAIVILTDVTERRQAEAVRMEKERLAGVLEMAGATARELSQPIRVAVAMTWRLRNNVSAEDPLLQYRGTAGEGN